MPSMIGEMKAQTQAQATVPLIPPPPFPLSLPDFAFLDCKTLIFMELFVRSVAVSAKAGVEARHA